VYLPEDGAGSPRGHHTDESVDELLATVDRAGRPHLAAGLTTICYPQVSRRELAVYRSAKVLYFAPGSGASA
jgi:hypothetical protein